MQGANQPNAKPRSIVTKKARRTNIGRKEVNVRMDEFYVIKEDGDYFVEGPHFEETAFSTAEALSKKTGKEVKVLRVVAKVKHHLIPKWARSSEPKSKKR